MRAGLFKRRDVTLLVAAALSAPAYWVFAPTQTAVSLAVILSLSWIFLVAIYTFNRLTELEEGQAASRGHMLILALSIAAFVPLFDRLPNRLAKGAALTIMVIGALYSIRLRVGERTFQLKKLYLLKPLMVCTGHCLQWLAFTGDTSPTVLLLLVWQFLDLLVLTTLLDITDIREDAAAGVRTFAVAHGFRGALRISLHANTACIVTGVVAMVSAESWPLALYLLPRPLNRLYRMARLRAGKAAKGLDTTLLRVVGLIGVGVHWWLAQASSVT